MRKEKVKKGNPQKRLTLLNRISFNSLEKYIDKPKIHVDYVKTQLQKFRKIGLNRTYNVLKRFFQLQQLRKISVIVIKNLVYTRSKKISQ